MRSVAALLCGFLAGAALADDAKLPVLMDSREALRGWEAVGMIQIENSGYCTGTLIAPDLVLTAASCLMTAEGKPVDASKITFRAGLIQGVSLADSTVTRTILPEGYRRLDPVPAEMIPLDVALMELATPVPGVVIASFAVAPSGSDAALELVYYGGALTEAPTRISGCGVEGKQGALYGLDCGTDTLVPGAPIFAKTGYRAAIVGIASTYYMDRGRTILLAAELPAAVAALKEALRRGEATSSTVAAAKPGVKRIKPGDESGTGAKFLSP